MKNILTFEEFLLEKQKHHPGDPPEIGLYSKGGKEALKGTGYSDKEKAVSTCKQLDGLKKKGEDKWAMSIATTMESRAKKHQHQTPEMREAMKIFREWIDKNKIKESLEEGKSTGLFHPGDKDAVKGTGYGSKEKALETIKIIDDLKKKDHKHAMAIATTMMNRAEYSANQTDGMKEAIPIFKEWIEKNRTT
jgi:hypothetical protein